MAMASLWAANAIPTGARAGPPPAPPALGEALGLRQPQRAPAPRVGETLRIAQRRAVETRADELGGAEVRIDQGGVAQVRMTEVSALEVCPGEIGAGQGGADEARAGQIGESH